MSYYEDERQRTRPTREKSRRDDYDEDSIYGPRGYNSNNRTTTLIKRRDSYDDVDEEITRDFSPPDGRGGYYRETTIRKSGVRPARARSFDDDRYFDDHRDDRRDNRRDEGAYVGARRGDRDRDDRRDRDRRQRRSSDYSSPSRSRTPPKRERRKSRVEETLESLGVGGLVGGLLGKENKDRQRSKSRGGRGRAYSETRSERRSRSGEGTTREQVTQAIKAALLAGAGEAFRARNEPGGFTGDKGKRILTAAISAGGVDGLINAHKDPERHSTRDTIGSAIAGLATSRIVNGPRSKSRGRGGSRSPDTRRGRSSSRGGVGDLLAGGAVAAAAKKVYDNVRSKSRGRSESRSRYSDTSRSPSRGKSRRRSVSQAAARGLAAVGLNSVAEKVDPNRERGDGRKSRRRNSDDYDDRSSYYDDYREDVGQPRSGAVNGRARSVSQSRSDTQDGQPRGITPNGYALDYGPRHNGDPDTDSDSDLGSSSEEENAKKKGKRKMILTTGLASVATIHAGHSIYQSYEQRHARKAAVREGKITEEQAKETRNRDRLQEAASVGIAALGLKGAYSEWKEMKEHRSELREEMEKMERHRKKREARRHKYKSLEKQGYLDNGYASSMPNLHSPPPPMSAPPGGWHQPFEQQAYYNGQGPYATGGLQPGAPHYYDDNPYAGAYPYTPGQVAGSSLPPPPVGNDRYNPSRAARERSPSRGRPER